MEWIKCSDRLPELYEAVLFWDNYYKGIHVGSYGEGDDEDFIWAGEEGIYDLDDISHWMPLPEPPDDDLHIKKSDIEETLGELYNSEPPNYEDL